MECSALSPIASATRSALACGWDGSISSLKVEHVRHQPFGSSSSGKIVHPISPEEAVDVPDHGEHMGETAELSGVELAPELTRYLPYVMRRAFAHVSANAVRSTPARDFAVLANLADHHVSSQQELAERLEINRTSMVKLIDRLQDIGYVTRTRNPENRRSYVLSLTAQGRDALDEIRHSVMERDEVITAALRPDERERLNDLLRTVLGEPEETPNTLSTEYLISQVFYLLRRRGDAMVSDIGLRIRNFASLSAIGKLGPCPQLQLARYLAVTEPSAAQIVEQLVQAGLVARGQDPADRRRYALELTDLGKERLTALRNAMDRLQAELVETLGGPDREQEIHSLLDKLLPSAPRRSNIEQVLALSGRTAAEAAAAERARTAGRSM
jgi:DNA-binding MarR family transcriptional regulator